jgi:hypothetical protein
MKCTKRRLNDSAARGAHHPEIRVASLEEGHVASRAAVLQHG